MLSLLNAFNELKLDEYVDITDPFFESIDKIVGSTVVKSEYFNLLEGTRAVEIGNTRLDTGLIPCSEEDLEFDTSSPQTSLNVLGISRELLKQLMIWFNNSSLPVTVLSCRYVQTLLENYSKTREEFSFTNHRLAHLPTYDSLSVEYKLVHTVLKAYVLGLVKFVGVCLQIAVTTLYEEEDLITRNMDLDFLSEVEETTISNQIDESIKWLETTDDVTKSDSTRIVHYLHISKKLMQIPEILVNQVPLFTKTGSTTENPIKLLLAMENIDELIKLDFSDTEIPQGCFSKFVQLDSNNKNIPSALTSIDDETCFKLYREMFQVITDYVNQSYCIATIDHFNQLLTYDISYKINSRYNGITRGLFQLYLIRDDKSILGSEVSMESLCRKLVEGFTCIDSQLFNSETWYSIQGLPEYVDTIKLELHTKLNALFADIETGIYQNLICPTNNRCRQRQLMSRNIVLWDTLQVNSESFEIELFEKYGVGDRLEGAETLDGEPALPLSSFVYATKLHIMLEVALSGFELDLYKPYEMSWMFWYITYLSGILIDLYNKRIKAIIILKRNYITISLPKKIKKLKAGSKKQALKKAYEVSVNETLPVLKHIDQFNTKYTIKGYRIIHLLAESLRIGFVALHTLGLFELFPKFEMAPLDKTYSLRMKPWSSVGVPNLPTFEQYVKNTESYTLQQNDSRKSAKLYFEAANNKVAESKILCQELLDLMEKDSDQIISKGMKEWYESLFKTCVMYSIEWTKLHKLVSQDFDSKTHCILVSEGYNRYFPRLSFQNNS